MTKYVTYYRCSTVRQGQSGLGLEAQEAAVNAFLKPDDEIMMSFTEVASRRKNDRPELQKAIQACKEFKATLLVSNMTRLTGNATFFFTLRDSGLPLKFADMAEADELVIGIMALLAERETKVIRKRIVDALAAKKARQEPMGKPGNFSNESRKAGSLVMHQQFIRRVDNIKFALQMFIKERKKDKEIIDSIQGMYPRCSESFIRRAIKYVKSLEETSTLTK